VMNTRKRSLPATGLSFLISLAAEGAQTVRLGGPESKHIDLPKNLA
jgi:hypothetical protein